MVMQLSSTRGTRDRNKMSNSFYKFTTMMFRRCNLPGPCKIPKGTPKSFYKMCAQFSKWHIVLVRKNINSLHFNSIFVHKRS